MSANPASGPGAASALLRSTFDAEAVAREIRRCRAELGSPPDLAFAFLSPDWKPRLEEFLEIVQIDGHAARLLGCSAGGLIGTGREEENVSGMSLLFLRLPGALCERAEISEEDLRDAESGMPWPGITGMAPDDFGSWLALAHPARVQSEAWLRQWNSAYPGEALYGGLCSGGADPGEMFLFTEAGLSPAAVLAARLSGGARLGGVVSQGCRPIGEPYTITGVQGNLVLTIAQRRAYEVLEEAYESLEEEDQAAARGNIFAGLAMTEYKDELKRGDFLVRNILGGDPAGGALALGTYPRVGQTLQFQLRDKDAADEDLQVQCAGALARYGAPFAALLFSCAGRGAGMFEAPDHDAGVLQEVFGPIPASGFFCNGEFGPVGGKNFIHGYTASAAFFLHP